MACGGGTRTNTRVKIWANDKGSKCEGNGNVEEQCNTHDCPGNSLADNKLNLQCNIFGISLPISKVSYLISLCSLRKIYHKV